MELVHDFFFPGYILLRWEWEGYLFWRRAVYKDTACFLRTMESICAKSRGVI